MAPPLRRLATTGRAEHVELEGNMQRHLDGVRADMQTYTPGNAAHWVAPAPTTIAQALDRLAAAGGVTPVP